jgi:starch phosphorylase
MGYFSSDRTITEYAEEIWDVAPVDIQLPADNKDIRIPVRRSIT